jgi:hypothetical protein
MSSAFYPLGMNSWNNRTNQNGYKSWKGKGIYSNPIAITSSNIRPLTNKDIGNVFPTGFGLPRPIKHFRKGTVIPILLEQTNNPQILQIQYNINRNVKSSNGNGNLVSQTIDKPGSFIVKDNSLLNNNDTNKIDNDCTNCQGVGIISNWYPINNLTEKPQPNVTNNLLCCNEQKKAIKRVLPASTLVKKNYFQTNYMYLYNRCQTFKQRQFNFVSGTIDENILNIIKQYPFVSLKILEYAKPGSPLSLTYLYVAQCNPNYTIDNAVEIQFITFILKSLLQQNIIDENQYTIFKNYHSIQKLISVFKNILQPEQFNTILQYLYEVASYPYNNHILSNITNTNAKGCKTVYYKPNNPQFATQGGVSSSTRLLKLNVDTITTNASSLNLNFKKQKTNSCDPFLLSRHRQNKQICYK